MPSFNTASQLSANVLDTVAPLLVTATDKSSLNDVKKILTAEYPKVGDFFSMRHVKTMLEGSDLKSLSTELSALSLAKPKLKISGVDANDISTVLGGSRDHIAQSADSFSAYFNPKPGSSEAKAMKELENAGLSKADLVALLSYSGPHLEKNIDALIDFATPAPDKTSKKNPSQISSMTVLNKAGISKEVLTQLLAKDKSPLHEKLAALKVFVSNQWAENNKGNGSFVKSPLKRFEEKGVKAEAILNVVVNAKMPMPEALTLVNRLAAPLKPHDLPANAGPEFAALDHFAASKFQANDLMKVLGRPNENLKITLQALQAFTQPRVVVGSDGFSEDKASYMKELVLKGMSSEEIVTALRKSPQKVEDNLNLLIDALESKSSNAPALIPTFLTAGFKPSLVSKMVTHDDQIKRNLASMKEMMIKQYNPDAGSKTKDGFYEPEFITPIEGLKSKKADFAEIDMNLNPTRGGLRVQLNALLASHGLKIQIPE